MLEDSRERRLQRGEDGPRPREAEEIWFDDVRNRDGSGAIAFPTVGAVLVTAAQSS